MPVSADTLDLLMRAGFKGTALVEVVRSIDRDNTPKKTGSAERQARYRERHRVTQQSDVTTVTNEPPTRAEPEQLTPTQQETKTKEQKDRSPSAPKTSPRDQLARVLDAERAEAVVEHRSRLRKPLTAHGAKVLAGKFARCPDPNLAADEMIANGWIGFRPDWLANRTSTGPPNGNGKPTMFDVYHAAKAEAQRIRDEREADILTEIPTQSH